MIKVLWWTGDGMCLLARNRVKTQPVSRDRHQAECYRGQAFGSVVCEHETADIERVHPQGCALVLPTGDDTGLLAFRSA